MKIFISADIEGVADATYWDETDPNKAAYKAHAEQMTREVCAACEGALRAGATEIVVRDAHGQANNIDPLALPEGVKLLRGWSGHPYSMVEGLDKSFDAALYIGYHSAASRGGNPLSHTFHLYFQSVRLNGKLVSEFTLYSWAALLEGVPSVFLSGDKMLCDDSWPLHPGLVTCAVKEGFGGSTLSLHPLAAANAIRDGAERALRQDLKAALGTLPEEFTLELRYKEPWRAEKASYFPGAELTADDTVVFKTRNYFEVLRVFCFA